MYLCNDTFRLPPDELVAAMRDAGAKEEDYPRPYDSVGCCELGSGHGERHAEYKFACGTEPELWVEWDDDGNIEFVRLTPCGQSDETLPPGQQQACTLPTDHGCGHSWEAVDLPHR
ncbi:hypothetical protein ACGF1Z_29830 [Streptomyces sp. NPDC048018]|uniref:hypothetical protein n=1 Tax=Streptomyces sp. NPDC048018 TaxID=3365499 RepID=UPI0037125F27